MTVELKPHHWGCKFCYKEYPKSFRKKIPMHTITAFDFGTKGLPVVTVPCFGVGEPAVQWFRRVYPVRGEVLGFVRKDWKPKSKKKIS